MLSRTTAMEVCHRDVRRNVTPLLLLRYCRNLKFTGKIGKYQKISKK